MALFMQQPMQQPAAAGGGIFGQGLANFDAHMSKPWVSALMGFGGGMLNSAQNGGDFGQGLQAGAGGALSGLYGAARLRRQKMDDEQRNRVMQELIQRYAQIGQGSAGVPGGIFASTTPAFPAGMLR